MRSIEGRVIVIVVDVKGADGDGGVILMVMRGMNDVSYFGFQ